MNNEMQILNSALDRCRELLAVNPQFAPLLSVEAQLQYLIGILDGHISDRSRLSEIIIGLYAAREFEDRDMAFANQLYQVVEIVDAMEAGKL
jgi:hypothetical protein